MSQYGVRVDCFTSLDDLKPKERKDPDAVLAALRGVSRISVWDMDNRDLCATITALRQAGRVTLDAQALAYPWIAVAVAP